MSTSRTSRTDAPRVLSRRGSAAGTAQKKGSTGADRTVPPVFAGVTRSAAVFALLIGSAALVAVLVSSGVTRMPPVVGLAEPSPVVRWGIPVVRILVDLAAVTTAGLGLLAKFIGFDRPDRSEPLLRRSYRVAEAAAWVWTGAAVVSVVLLTAELQPGSVPSPGDVWTYVGSIAAGKGLLLSGACGLISVWLLRLTRRHGERVPAELRAGVALFGLLPLPLTGHATNWVYHDLSMVSMEMHVVAASAWAGGLGAVLVYLSGKPDLLAVALPRFSRLATWCVVVVGLTGLFNGLLELAVSPVTDLPASLWTTRYGVLVLAKTALMIVVAALAVVVRQRLLPRIVEQRRTAVAAWCGWELIVLALAFGVAVALTRASVLPF